jgi:hypothetical protein
MMPDGTAKITDFGLAKARVVAGESVVAGAERSILVSTGGMTPAYCSPEQANRQPLSRKTDIWSWAVSVVEIFAGGVFWPSGTVARAALDQLDGTTAEGIPAMPMGLKELLKQCLNESPDSRPKSFAEVSQQLLGIFREELKEEYFRMEPRSVEFRADELNNRALSLLDLGKEAEAIRLFDDALKLQPVHPEATYNAGLVNWRKGLITDDVLLGRLRVAEQGMQNWRALRLQGLIWRKIGDAKMAARALERAVGPSGNAPEVISELKWAHAASGPAGRVQQELAGHSKCINNVNVSRDGRFAVTSSDDHTVRLWDLHKGECARVLTHSSHVISFAAFLPGRPKAVSGSSDGIRIWNLVTGDTEPRFPEYDSGGLRFAISQDGRWMVSDGDKASGCQVRLWSVETGECIRTFDCESGIFGLSLAISTDGQCIVVGAERGLQWLDAASGDCIHSSRCDGERVASVAISEDGRWVADTNPRSRRLRHLSVAHG